MADRAVKRYQRRKRLAIFQNSSRVGGDGIVFGQSTIKATIGVAI